MATLIRVDGMESPFAGKKKQLSLEEMQGAVGGYIEVVRLKHWRRLVIDEEGKLKSRPPNPRATMLALADDALLPGDYIVGDALLLGRGEGL